MLRAFFMLSVAGTYTQWQKKTRKHTGQPVLNPLFFCILLDSTAFLSLYLYPCLVAGTFLRINTIQK